MQHEQLINFRIKGYNFLSLIGQGNFARVYEAYNGIDDTTVAIKVIPNSLFQQDPRIKLLAQSQIRIMKSLKNNPNVVRFIENFKTAKSTIIVMEYCEGGTLQEYLYKKKRLTQNEAINIIKQIINAFKGLHENNIVHRDLKTENILLKGGVFKLADFGLAKTLSSENSITKTVCGTSLTMAPQIYYRKPYGIKVDIWSLGVVFYLLIYGQYPYGENESTIFQKSIHHPKFDKIKNVSQPTKDFITRCLTSDPDQRISWKELYQHQIICKKTNIQYGYITPDQFLQNSKLYQKQMKIQNFLDNKLDTNSDIKAESLRMQEEAMKKAKAQNELKKKREAAIQSYKNIYLNYRNNIIFVFKYITSSISYLQKIPSYNPFLLFIICKKAYLDLTNFEQRINAYINFLCPEDFFNDFIKTEIYKEISGTIKTDIQTALQQTNQVRKTIKQGTVKFEQDLIFFNTQKPKNINLSSFFKDRIHSFQMLLIGGIDKISGIAKPYLIIVIQALHYLNNHKDHDQFEAFDQYIDNLNFVEAQKKIKQRQIQELNKMFR